MQKSKECLISLPPGRLCELSPRSSAPLHLWQPPLTAQPRYRWKGSARTRSSISRRSSNDKWNGLPATAAGGIRSETISDQRLTPIIRSVDGTPYSSFRRNNTRCEVGSEGNDRAIHRVRFYDYPEEEDLIHDQISGVKSIFESSLRSFSEHQIQNKKIERSEMFENDFYSYSTSVAHLTEDHKEQVPEPQKSSPSPPSYKSLPTSSASIEKPIKEEVREEVKKNEDQITIESTSLKVYIRVRPLDEQDIVGVVNNRPRTLTLKSKDEIVLSTRPSTKKENTGNKHVFRFDHVMNEFTSQREVFEVTTQPLLQKMLQGYNTSLIAYGSQGTGKTHSLFGKVSSGRHRALITRAAEVILSEVEKARKEHLKTRVTMSFVQIFNEKLYDILDPSANGNIRFQEQADSSRATLDGVSEWAVEKVDDVTKQLRRNPNRVRESGRSHTVFSLRYYQEEKIPNPEEREVSVTSSYYRLLKGKIDFVDLVGVGRTTKHSTNDSSGNQAAAKTNKSLQTFHSVINSLIEKDLQNTTYKDSKLTRMLQETLGGNCYSSILITASPCPNCAHETLSCLQFASKISSIRNYPSQQMSVEERPEDLNCGDLNLCTSETSLDVKGDELEEELLPPIEMKPYTISKTARSVTSNNDKARNVNLETKAETTESREKKIKTKIQGSAEDDLRKIKRKKRSSLASNQDQMKQQTNKIQPFLEMSLDGRELSASSSTSTKILTLPRIDTPEKTRREDLTSLAALRTRTPPPGKTILDVSSNFRLRSSVDTSLSNSVKTVTRKSSRRSSIKTSMESSKSKTDPEIKEASRAPTPEVMTSSANCCEQCRMREDKIRSNYDRMIMLSKRDRDEKEQKICELKKELERAQNESRMLAENERLHEEVTSLKKDLDILQTDKMNMTSQLEIVNSRLAKMVPSIELYNLQDLRRKDSFNLEEQKIEIKSLQKNLEDQTKGAAKMLEKKVEQNEELKKELIRLKQELKEMKPVEVEKMQRSTKSSEISKRSKDEEMEKMKKQIEELKKVNEEKENEKDQILEEKVCISKALIAAQKQIEMMENGECLMEVKSSDRKLVDCGTNTEDFRYKLKGLAYYVYCLRCAANYETNEDSGSSDVTAAKMRLLLMQDMKNQETLYQLNRERNLLRDVMKIMYSRQWFSDEGKPHVRRALQRVGIDVLT